jgi:hypothetical protein
MVIRMEKVRITDVHRMVPAIPVHQDIRVAVVTVAAVGIEAAPR